MNQKGVTVKTVTTTREYDEHGHCIRETRVEVEHPEPHRPYDGYWWQPDPNPWWRNPVISYVSTTTSASAPVLIN